MIAKRVLNIQIIKFTSIGDKGGTQREYTQKKRVCRVFQIQCNVVEMEVGSINVHFLKYKVLCDIILHIDYHIDYANVYDGLLCPNAPKAVSCCQCDQSHLEAKTNRLLNKHQQVTEC